ncbi:glycerol kinase [Coriobacterium glomerans PW2]|uniref:glycerol kinase n=1 Tax=Coriobacterium glomerans (strain ATCC 49209 / DSM 20642 / JCM 10262 / PW2) TaxID=700015 RepID=F2NAC1_CORGP|nr:glycerol kinase GlpK [Coriobacterium glomerans]AEB06307.1 glycerol kinase [Coriobacterium glomerans PW2]
MMFTLNDLDLVDSACATGSSYIMALDCGTTSVRASIIDQYGCIVAAASRAVKTSYPHPGWVEQDPTEILASQLAVMIEVQFKSGIHSDGIAAVGISNQRETTVVWERDSAQPICNAIVWQCRRTAPIAEALKEHGMEDMIRKKTGLRPDAYFSATKIAWILENVSGAREAAEAGQLMFGTIDTWLIYNLTGGKVFATEYTNASRTMLFNIHTLDWDDELLRIMDIPRCMLPDVRWSAGEFGRVCSDIMTHTPPIAGVAGDQQASLFGHCCFAPGQTKNTYGTGCFMLMNTGEQVVESNHGLVSTIGIAQGGSVSYALEGSIFHAGSVMQWLRDRLQIISDVADTEMIARSRQSNDGCYLVPAFTGLGAPWWDPDARALIWGLTSASDRACLVRAACESMAYQSYDVLRAMEADADIRLSSLSVDGAASRNGFIMQFQADLLGIPIVRSESIETTSLGAAFLAGLAVGYWEDREELEQSCGASKRFEPKADESRARDLAGWHAAVAKAAGSPDGARERASASQL